MSVTNRAYAEDANVLVTQGFKLKSATLTLAGTLTMVTDWPPLTYLDPGGAGRDVLLPPEAANKDVCLILVNIADAAETLTVKEDSGTTTIATIAGSAAGATNARGIFHCDGTTWRCVGVPLDT